MKSFTRWLEDLDTLRQNTAGGMPATGRRQNAVAEVGEPSMFVTPNPEAHELLVKATVPGSQDNVYRTSILFKNVNFKPLPPGGQMALGSYLITNPRTGVKYYLDRLSTSGNNVQVNCTCPDFRHTFSRHNHAQGALLGEPDAGEPRPGRNPGNLPGLCKHLLRVMQALEEKGILIQGRY